MDTDQETYNNAVKLAWRHTVEELSATCSVLESIDEDLSSVIHLVKESIW